MASTRTASKATVTTAEDTWGPVRLRVWGNVATVRHQTSGAAIHTREGVKAVGPVHREGQLNRFQVSFEDGTVWEVSEPRRGCGCGR